MAVPRVSVVVPAYNPGEYLLLALESLVSQTCSEWEAIVVDDGSTENLDWVSSIDRRIGVLRQENAGLSAARNAAIEASSAPLVAFLDADDVWYPEKLTTQLQLMEADPAMPGSSTAFDIIDANGARVGPGFRGHHKSFVELLLGNGIGVSTVIVRREPLVRSGLFDLRLSQAQDWCLWLSLAKRAPFGYVDEPLAGYRMHGENMSGNYRRLLREGTLILSGHERTARNRVEADAAHEGMRRLRRLCGAQAYDQFRVSRNLGALRDALRLSTRYTLVALVHFVLVRSHRLLQGRQESEDNNIANGSALDGDGDGQMPSRS